MWWGKIDKRVVNSDGNYRMLRKEELMEVDNVFGFVKMIKNPFYRP